MKKISIVGFGRFGKTLYSLIKDDFIITIYDKNKINPDNSNFNKNTLIAKNASDIYKSEVIFYTVPISNFEEVITSHKKYFEDNHLLIDTLSVKLYPANIFKKHLGKGKTQAILTHPMFGPDSSKNGFKGLPIVIDQFMANDNAYSFWKEYFISKALKLIEMSPDNHDKIAANSQGLTHFLGRLLEEFKFEETQIDSLGAKKLLEIKEQTCNDSWQLFTDLQQYNPYTGKMRLRLGAAYDKLYNKLLPKQIDANFITYGIQGGRGSFNEEAILYFSKKASVKKNKIKYLYTAENVLTAIHKGEIDIGQLALHNSVGGIVEESIFAMAKYKFNIVNQFAIKISHALMIRIDAEFEDITTIMSHPQVFAQCRTTLSKKYTHLKQVRGEGEFIDQTMVAKHMSEKKLPKSVATMGSRILSKMYGLRIIEDNLQDAKENYTYFLHIKKL